MASFGNFSVGFANSRYIVNFEITYQSFYPIINPRVILRISGNFINQVNPEDAQSFEVSQSTHPNLFLQGVSIYFQAFYSDDDGSVSSDILYRVLQRETDNGECLVMTKPVYFTEITQSNNSFKSVILPRPTIRGTKVGFKIKTSNTFTVCVNMSNITYPHAETTLATTNSSFNNIYFNKLPGGSGENFGNIVFPAGSQNKYLELITNQNLEWITSKIYQANLTISSSIPETSITDTTNSRMIYYECTNQNRSVILANAINGFQKDVYIRNLTGSQNTFFIYAPLNYSIDSVQNNIGQRVCVSLLLDADGFFTVSFFYNVTSSNSNLHITNYYSDSNISYFTSGTYKTPDITISSPISYISLFTNSNITFPPAYPNAGNVTYYDVYDGSILGGVSVPVNSTANYIATGNATNPHKGIISLNYQFFHFAVLFKNVNSSNIYLPLGGSTD